MAVSAPCIKEYLFKTVIFFSSLFLFQNSYSQQGYDTVTIDEINNQYNDDAAAKNYFQQKWEQDDSLKLQQRNIPTKQVKKLQDQDAFWYANSEIKKEEPVQERMAKSYVPLGQRTWFQTLLWLVIIGGFAAAVMWFLAGSQVGLFRKRNKIGKQESEAEVLTEDIFAINYQQEIDKAAQSGNYRLAVRLMFLRLLKNMAERNIIQYTQDKTNLDYLLQLRPTSYYNNFFRITRNYEYAWYGLFEMSEGSYNVIKNEFNQFDRFLG